MPVLLDHHQTALRRDGDDVHPVDAIKHINVCSCCVRGEITRSERIVKIRKSPTGRESTFFQGLMSIFGGCWLIRPFSVVQTCNLLYRRFGKPFVYSRG
jgi:hypothetical protein